MEILRVHLNTKLLPLKVDSTIPNKKPYGFLAGPWLENTKQDVQQLFSWVLDRKKYKKEALRLFSWALTDYAKQEALWLFSLFLDRRILNKKPWGFLTGLLTE